MANTPNINLVKPLGTDRALVSVINDNSDKIDAFAGSANTNMANTQNGYAIVVDGNNAPKAITAGQYLFIKNHSTLSTGGYHATANIANGAAITSSNVAADADGVVNGAFAALNSKINHRTLLLQADVNTITTSETIENTSGNISDYTYIFCVLFNYAMNIKVVVSTLFVPAAYFADSYRGTTVLRTRYITGDLAQAAGIDVKYASNTSVGLTAINSYTADNYGILLYGIM